MECNDLGASLDAQADRVVFCEFLNEVCQYTCVKVSQFILLAMDNWTSVNLTTAHGNASKPSGQPSLVHVVTAGIMLSLITCQAIIGNVLVILSVCTNRKLRTITNRFLVSLVTADLLVAVLVLPLAIKVEATESWNLGSIPCEVWIGFDVMLCTALILNLLCISVDRY